MTKPTLLALTNLFSNQMEELEKKFEIIHLYKENDPEAVLGKVKDKVQAILCTMHNTVRQNLIDACPNLEIIVCKSVGFDNVDVSYAASKNIIVTNTPDLVTNDTADTAIGLLINVSRRYVELDAYTRVGRWKNGGSKPLGHSLSNKKVGIVGLGRIGQAIAKRCAAFDMVICYHTRSKKNGFDYTYYDNLKKMAEDVDYLIAVVPGGAETEKMINAEIMDALGPNGYLINIARGTVVDEAALVDALKDHKIAGAALDVYENEPHVPDELKTMDNVVLLPHVGAATYETLGAMGDLIIENLCLHFDGKPVKTPVQI
jgi:lactate dehydrogenase-like 2-hydroxyacid dehydrogenase